MFTLLSLFLIGLGATTAIEYGGYGGGPAYHGGPALVKGYGHEAEAPAHYDFSYSVHDDHTGDVKSQSESRKDDQVHGQYSLIDADGYLRTVDYTSDAHNGFNAVVRREPLGHKHEYGPSYGKAAYAAPAAYASPKLISAPKYGHSY